MKEDYFKELLTKNGDFKILQKPNFLWTPVRAKPRQEKRLVEYCNANEIEYYLPLRKNVKRYQRRNVEFYIPMFTGYVFCSLNHSLYQKILLSNRVVYKLQMSDKSEPELIRELESIQILEKISTENEIVVMPELVVGTKIKVKSGPLRGTSGVVERRKGKTMIFINVDMLGQSVSTEIDLEDLQIEE